MNNKEKIIYLTIGVLVFIATVVGITYAFFPSLLTGQESGTTITITSGEVGLVFADGSDEMAPTNIAPGWSATKTFSITAPSANEGIAYYNIVFDNVTNTFVNQSDLVYTLSSTNGGGSKTQTAVPATGTTTTVISNVSINKNVTQTYTLTVSYLNNPAVNQIADKGKAFAFKIKITP